MGIKQKFKHLFKPKQKKYIPKTEIIYSYLYYYNKLQMKKSRDKIIVGSFDDIIKASVAGNPTPKARVKKKKTKNNKKK